MCNVLVIVYETVLCYFIIWLIFLSSYMWLTDGTIFSLKLLTPIILTSHHSTASPTAFTVSMDSGYKLLKLIFPLYSQLYINISIWTSLGWRSLHVNWVIINSVLRWRGNVTIGEIQNLELLAYLALKKALLRASMRQIQQHWNMSRQQLCNITEERKKQLSDKYTIYPSIVIYRESYYIS